MSAIAQLESSFAQALQTRDREVIDEKLRNLRFPAVNSSALQDPRWMPALHPAVPAYVAHRNYGPAMLVSVRDNDRPLPGFSRREYLVRLVNAVSRRPERQLYVVPHKIAPMNGVWIEVVRPLKRLVTQFVPDRDDPTRSRVWVAEVGRVTPSHTGGAILQLPDFLSNVSQDDGTQGWLQAFSAFSKRHPEVVMRYMDRIYTPSQGPMVTSDAPSDDYSTLTPSADNEALLAARVQSKLIGDDVWATTRSTTTTTTATTGMGFGADTASGRLALITSPEARSEELAHSFRAVMSDIDSWYGRPLCELPGARHDARQMREHWERFADGGAAPMSAVDTDRVLAAGGDARRLFHLPSISAVGLVSSSPSSS